MCYKVKEQWIAGRLLLVVGPFFMENSSCGVRKTSLVFAWVSDNLIQMSLKEVLPTYTVEDYLQWEGDWELWEGSPVAMAPPSTPEHQNTGTNLVVDLATQLKEAPCANKYRVFYELDWHVNQTTVVRPDVMIYCHGMPEGKWISKPPTLIAEILSPSTRDRDLIGKRELYAQNSVKYYLISDPESKSVQLFLLSGESYHEIDWSSRILLTEEYSVSLNTEDLFS